jgi:hypothetical protein
MCEAAQACGVPYVTVRWHIVHDPAFAEQVELVHKEFVERAKGYMLTHMARPGNYMDRVTIARRFEPGVWGDQVRHSVEVNVTHVQQALQRAEAIETDLEVESKREDGTTEWNNGSGLKPPGGGVNDGDIPSTGRRMKKVFDRRDM